MVILALIRARKTEERRVQKQTQPLLSIDSKPRCQVKSMEEGKSVFYFLVFFLQIVLKSLVICIEK